jgi:LacI family transcriptional regulator
MTRPAKLSDVARLAGVSAATVSRALNTPELVRSDTRQGILDAITRLGYVPHGSARALASRRTRTVGLVVPTIDHAIFSRFAQSMQTELAEAGYQLLIASHEYSAALELNGARALIERGVDALVLVGLVQGQALSDVLSRATIPILRTWTYDRTGRSLSVGFDNVQAGERVAKHLLALGHRRFGVISGFLHYNDRARGRVEGVRKALREAGLDLPAANVVEQPFTYAGGRAGLRALLGLSPRPTAVVCGNDLLGIGALLECQDVGLPVPEAISITGFDNQELTSHIRPGLTTVNLPLSDLGRRATEILLGLLAGEVLEASVELPVELVIRGSTAPAPTR